MKVKGLSYYVSLIMLMVMGFSIIPLSALHHHENERVCDVASAIPTKYKKEKDQSRHHFHTYSKSCFLCTNAPVNIKADICIQENIHNDFFSNIEHFYFYAYSYSSKVSYANKAPPALTFS